MARLSRCARRMPTPLPRREVLLPTVFCHSLPFVETNRRNETITRYRPAGVTPLELWDMRVESRILWETMLEPQFPAVLRQTIETLRRGEGETRSEGRVPAIIAGFDSLFVAGRRSSEAAIRSSL